MLVSLEQLGADALAETWNAWLPKRYRIDPELVRINVLDSPLLEPGPSGAWFENGRARAWLAVKRPASAVYSGPSPETAHVCALAFESEAAGAALLDRAVGSLRPQGFGMLVFGTDLRHFWPGCPVDAPALRGLLSSYGFEEGAEVFDLERDLVDYDRAPYLYGAALEPVETRAIGQADMDDMSKFLNREFPGRWTYDSLAKVEAEGRSEFVQGLFVAGRLEGFALTQDASHRLPIGGAVWRNDLGPNWGSLGPIGVSESVRGRGLGDLLLASALLDLKSRGVRRCIIDWTTLGEFYGRHGFVPTRFYRSMNLSLG